METNFHQVADQLNALFDRLGHVERNLFCERELISLVQNPSVAPQSSFEAAVAEDAMADPDAICDASSRDSLSLRNFDLDTALQEALAKTSMLEERLSAGLCVLESCAKEAQDACESKANIVDCCSGAHRDLFSLVRTSVEQELECYMPKVFDKLLAALISNFSRHVDESIQKWHLSHRLVCEVVQSEPADLPCHVDPPVQQRLEARCQPLPDPC